MAKRPEIVLVTHTIPLDSGFLAAKFILLSKKMDVHLYTWDTKQNLEKFIVKNNLPDTFKKKIHLAYSQVAWLQMPFNLWAAVIADSSIRKFLLLGEDRFMERVKFVLTYLPLLSLNPEIIHFEFGTLAQKAVKLKLLTKAKLSTSFRGYDLNYAGLDNDEYYNDVWESFDGFHFLGGDLKERAIKRGYKNDGAEVIIPPAIDSNFFTPQNSERSDEKYIITSVGRLVWKKGYEYAIKAMVLLKKQNISFEYRIIGSGDYLQAIQYIVSELGLTGNVKILGELTEEKIKYELNHTNVFLHPAVSEGFSNAVLEAQAMSLPIVCTDADGLTENIEDNVTGFVVPKWDAEAIAAKLMWCYANREEAREMGKKGVERVNKFFRIEQQIDTFVKYYQDLMKHEG